MPSVLHISAADNLGGAARSAYKIHTGIRKLGWGSRMLVKTKVTDDPDVDSIHGGRLTLRLFDLAGRHLVDALGGQYLFYPSSFAIARHPWFQASDVVQLYNLHGGYFTYRALPRLAARRPLVLRLSDMWPLTGHCAYSHDCQRWKTGCGECPLLGEYPALARDTTAWLFRSKERVYQRLSLVLVATNRWMEALIRQSPLLGRFPVHLIPNGVDPEVFRPIEKAVAREALHIDPAARVVLFLAHVAKPGTRKGAEYVPLAMERLAGEGVENLWLMVGGEAVESWPEGRGYRTLRLGFTTSEKLLAIVYSAADVLVYPVLAENFPNSVLESMACATPAVAFDVGGVSEAVRHRETGYLAEYKNADDLVRGAALLLKERSLTEGMGRRCRAVVEQEYSSDLQARRFAELYRSLTPPGAGGRS
jgi:glycosyltransferase involved in cell wall biosynthesis